jgi:putative endonuclease
MTDARAAAGRRRATGRAGEDAAAAFLRRRGLHILRRNYATPFGELDLVARAGDVVVFVEVKAANAGAATDPRRQFTPRKVKRVYNAALYYLARECPGEDPDFRFDFVVVTRGGDRVTVEHHAAVPLQDFLPAPKEEP